MTGSHYIDRATFIRSIGPVAMTANGVEEFYARHVAAAKAAAEGRAVPPFEPPATRFVRPPTTAPRPTLPSTSSTPTPPRSTMPPDPKREVQRLARLAARIELLERDILPRAKTFEQRLAELEEDARRTGNVRHLEEIASIRRARKAELADERSGETSPPTDASARAADRDAMDRAMGRVVASGTGVVRSADGRSIQLGASVEDPTWVPSFRPSKSPPDTRTDKERQRDLDALKRAMEPTPGFAPSPRDTTSARAPGDTRTAAEREHDAAAMRVALGSNAVAHSGTRRTRNGIQLGVTVDTTNNRNRNR